MRTGRLKAPPNNFYPSLLTLLKAASSSKLQVKAACPTPSTSLSLQVLRTLLLVSLILLPTLVYWISTPGIPEFRAPLLGIPQVQKRKRGEGRTPIGPPSRQLPERAHEKYSAPALPGTVAERVDWTTDTGSFRRRVLEYHALRDSAILVQQRISNFTGFPVPMNSGMNSGFASGSSGVHMMPATATLRVATSAGDASMAGSQAVWVSASYQNSTRQGHDVTSKNPPLTAPPDKVPLDAQSVLSSFYRGYGGVSGGQGKAMSQGDNKKTIPLRVGLSREDSELFNRALAVDSESTPTPTPVSSSANKGLPGQPAVPGVDLLHQQGQVPRQQDKVAFLFLTKGPLPLAPVWARFFAGHEGKFSIYIHLADVSNNHQTELPRVFQGRHIASKRVWWGHISMVDAERRLLANALLDPLNTRFVLLSESCMPLYNFTLVYNHVMSTQKEYVSIMVQPGRSGQGRWRRDFLPLIPASKWRKGGQWFQITRWTAKLILRDEAFYRKFKNHCKQPCQCDEHYLPTMLHTLGVPNLARRDLTWTDWSTEGTHPREFSVKQLSANVMKSMRGKRVRDCNFHCKLFARKVVPGSEEDLMSLAHTMEF